MTCLSSYFTHKGIKAVVSHQNAVGSELELVVPDTKQSSGDHFIRSGWVYLRLAARRVPGIPLQKIVRSEILSSAETSLSFIILL